MCRALLLNDEGNSLLMCGSYEEAIKCFNQAIKIDPFYENPWNNKGVALENLGRYKEAVKCFDNAIKINPEYVNAWLNKAKVLGGYLNRNVEALRCSNRAIRLDNQNRHCLFSKGAALSVLGQYEEALACFEKAEKLGHPQASNGVKSCKDSLKSAAPPPQTTQEQAPKAKFADAIFDNNFYLVHQMLKDGMDPNTDLIDTTMGLHFYPLNGAAYRKATETAMFLIYAGANVNGRNRTVGADTPLHCAALAGSKAITEALIEHGASVDAIDGIGLTPLYRAAENGNHQCVDLLLKAGANPHCADPDDGMTSLHAAAYYTSEGETIRLLVKAGANPNVKTTKGPYVGQTPLHMASFKPFRIEVVKALLESGADPEITVNNSTALQIAKSVQNDDIVRLINEYSAKARSATTAERSTHYKSETFESTSMYGSKTTNHEEASNSSPQMKLLNKLRLHKKPVYDARKGIFTKEQRDKLCNIAEGRCETLAKSVRFGPRCYEIKVSGKLLMEDEGYIDLFINVLLSLYNSKQYDHIQKADLEKYIRSKILNAMKRLPCCKLILYPLSAGLLFTAGWMISVTLVGLILGIPCLILSGIIILVNQQNRINKLRHYCHCLMEDVEIISINALNEIIDVSTQTNPERLLITRTESFWKKYKENILKSKHLANKLGINEESSINAIKSVFNKEGIKQYNLSTSEKEEFIEIMQRMGKIPKATRVNIRGVAMDIFDAPTGNYEKFFKKAFVTSNAVGHYTYG